MHGSYTADAARAQAGAPQLVPDERAISAHLYALFAPGFVYQYPDAWIEIAYGLPETGPNQARFFSAFDLSAAAKFAADKNRCGHNVYVGASLRSGEKPKSGRANDEHFLAARFSWCEYDGAGDFERIEAILRNEELEPALMVVTGTKPHQRAHLYFLNAQPITSGDEMKACNTALKHLLHSDDVNNPSRVLRLAGTINRPKTSKVAKGYVTELTTMRMRRDAPSYSVEALRALHPEGAQAAKWEGDPFEQYDNDHDLEADPELIAAAMEYIPNNDEKWGDWNRLAMAAWRATNGSPVAFAAFDKWSQKSRKYNARDTWRKWKVLSKSPPKRIGAGSVFKMALDNGWVKPGKTAADDTDGDNEAMAAASLPVVDVRGGELSNLATRSEEILSAAGVQIFQRSRQLVRPVIEEVDATRGRKTKICQLIPVVPDYLRDLLCRYAVWQRYDARSKQDVPIDPPHGVAKTILARTGEWRLFPAVCGVTSAPTMRPDGSLMIEPGFDHKTGLLLIEPPPMPAIPAAPTKADAEAALKLLEDLLAGFPFVDEVARAGALSAIITAVARGAFPVTPLHASRAPTAGSGKSFLWDIVAAIISGHPMPVISTGKDEIEMEKRLGAALMTGQPLISIDNISGELGGDALCQIIERPVVDIRVLGQSKNMRIEARGTSVYATGNNFTLVGDICRRVITINLDAGMERPELRQFDFDPIERVLADRGKYIAAALTIVRAYFVAGRPDKAPKLASFEGWSDTVRSALIWLGKEDPVKSMEVARQEDPELVELTEMLDAWSEVMGLGADNRAKLADVLLRCDAMSRESEDGELAPTYPRLNAAFKVVGQRYLGKPALPDARMLGKWLQRFKGRPAGGKKFMNLPDAKHGAQWWVEWAQQTSKPEQHADDDPQQDGVDFNSAEPERERS